MCPDGAAFAYSFSLSGISTVLCLDCPTINGTQTVTYAGVDCHWSGRGTGTFCGSSVVYDMSINSVAVDITFSGPGGGSFLYSAPSAGWDCKSAIALALITSDNTFCSGWPSSITLNPV